MASILLDILAVIILVVCFFVGRRRGFFAMLLLLIGGVLAALLAAYLANVLSITFFDTYMRSNLIDAMVKAVEEQSATGGTNAEDFLKTLPPLVQAFVAPALAKMTELMQGEISASVLPGATAFVDTTIRPMALTMIATTLFLVLFGVLYLVIRILAKQLRLLNKIPGIGGFNALAGGLVGLVQGFFVLLLLTAALFAYISLSQNQGKVMNQEVVENTKIVRYFYDNNPIGRFAKIDS